MFPDRMVYPEHPDPDIYPDPDIRVKSKKKSPTSHEPANKKTAVPRGHRIPYTEGTAAAPDIFVPSGRIAQGCL